MPSAIITDMVWRRTKHSSLLLIAFMQCATVWADPPDADGVDFFEKRIRPVLVERCYKCHSTSAKKLQAELLLDSRDGIRKGGESGPAIVQGKAGDSLLIKALRHEGPEMPPKNKLPPEVVADFVHWIEIGAPDPRDAAAAPTSARQIDFEAAHRHWAFQPIANPTVPQVRNVNWPVNQIDALVLARLEAAGLAPSPAADRRTLIRRLYFDLVGLPPTYEDVERFVNDTFSDSYAQLVDRLLTSPHYGERWGRHWLDVARYADTRDVVLVLGNDRIRPYAYTYRDYVVRALNEDTPYDRFLREQLAADKIQPPVEPWRLAAMGFLTLGRTFCNNLMEVYDDQIDTVTRGMLGLTVSCARCHDHKYDPIPAADYYSLYGVFANSEVPFELPLIQQPEMTPGYVEFEKKAAPLRKKLGEHVDAQYQLLTSGARARIADYLVKIVTEPPDPLENVVYALSLSPDDLRPQIVASWRRYLKQHAVADDPVFGPWHDLMKQPDDDFGEQAKRVLERWRQVPQGTMAAELNPLVAQGLFAAAFSSKSDVARWYGELLTRVYEQSVQAPVSNDKNRESHQQLVEIVTGENGPVYFPKRYAYQYMARIPVGQYHSQRDEIDRLAVASSNAPPRAMVLYDSPELHEPRIFLRGNPRQPGQRIPRQFLKILSDNPRQPFADGSGRLDLARAITSPTNPLTSRVLVNRVWMHHFGQPLVLTPSDFGTRSDPPSHPKLLDHLASSFMKDGWSLKKLHRRILLSQTYQQASFDRPDCRDVDPENRLLGRANRRRRDLEAMRDSLLAVSARLDRSLGGRPVDIVGDPQNRRRTIYGLVDRQDLPGLFRAFDFAVPDQTVAQRPRTSTPQQALFSMNSVFVIEQARGLAARLATTEESKADQRIKQLYRFVLCRDPSDEEGQSALRFIEQATVEQSTNDRSVLAPWEQLAHVMLLTNEWMFVD